MRAFWGLLVVSGASATSYTSALKNLEQTIGEKARLMGLSKNAGVTCTGATNPQVTDKRCYKGQGSVLGILTEVIEVQMESFSATSSTEGTGVVQLHSVSGPGTFHCDDRAFTKSGQTLTFNEDCLGAIHATALYCTDQDIVKVTVDYQGFTIVAPLAKVAC